MKISIKQPISVLLAGCLLSQAALLPAAEANLWQERKRLHEPVMLASLPRTSPPALDAISSALHQTRPAAALRSVPQQIFRQLSPIFEELAGPEGTVRRVRATAEDSEAPVVVHLQDIHQNHEAQNNISALTRRLIRRGAINLIAVEGAFDPIDLSVFRAFPYPPAIQRSADYLLKNHRLSGPIHAALTESAAVPVIGIDDRVHYDLNVAAYRRASGRQEALLAWIDDEIARNESIKTSVFNAALRRFDAVARAYHAEEKETGEFVDALLAHVPEPPPGVQIYREALRLEKNLAAPNVDAERRRLMEALSERLAPAEAERLLLESAALKAGRVSQNQFYGSLRDVCAAKGLRLEAFPALNDYVRYISLADGIDGASLLEQLTGLENRVYDALIRTDEEKRLVDQGRRFQRIKKLIGFALTPEEWEEYKKDVPGTGFPGSAEEQETKSRLATADLSSFERFYEEAELRDARMADRLSDAIRTTGARNVLLVTGGFHASGIGERLERAGAVLISAAPRITKVDRNGASDYLSVFARDKTPLEKLLAGEKLFLANHPMPPLSALETAAGAVAASRRENPNSASAWRSWLARAARLAGFRLTETPEMNETDRSTRFSMEGRAEKTGLAVAAESSVFFGAGGEIESIRTYQRRVALVMPLLETAVLTALVLVAKYHGLPMTPALAAGAAALLSTLHALMYRESSPTTSLFWFGGHLAILAPFLLPEIGPAAALSFFIHFSWNATFLALREKRGFLSQVFRPLSLLNFAPPESDRTVAKNLRTLIAARRGLVFTEDADRIDVFLSEESQKTEKTYLRLVLQDDEDLDRLLTQIRVHPDGQYEKADGPLLDLLRNGGILFIDYNNSDPKIVESFNSIFDKNPYFRRSVPRVSPDLVVIGAMNKNRFARHPASFFSRFKRIVSLPTERWKRPIDYIRRAPEGLDAEVVEMHESPFVHELLVENYRLGSNGRIQFDRLPGGLIRAIRAGKPLVIKGADWNELRLRHFIHSVILQGQIVFNGETIPVPRDFAIYYQDGEYGKHPLVNKRILAVNESGGGLLHIINRETVDTLFTQTRVAEPYLTQQIGLLGNGPVRIRVTDELPAWAWHRMLYETDVALDIEVAPGVPVPTVYRKWRSRSLAAQKDTGRAEPWETARQAPAAVIESADTAFAIAKIREAHPGKTISVFHATPNMSIDQLISSIEIAPGEAAGDRRFSRRPRPLAKAVEAGDVIVVTGLHANEPLTRQLESLAQEDPYFTDNGEPVLLRATGSRAYLVPQPSANFLAAAPHRTQIASDRAGLAALLTAEFGAEFSEKEIRMVLDLREIIGSIPPPSRPGLYPSAPEMGYDQLRHLLMIRRATGRWLEAFEDIVVGRYAESPEAAAFIRIQVRRATGEDDPRVDTQKINLPTLRRALRRMSPDTGWDEHFWEITSALGTHLLSVSGINTEFTKKNPDDVFPRVERALINYYEHDAVEDSRERAAYYRHIFGIDEDVTDAFEMETAIPTHDETWEERWERIERAMALGIPVMLIGSPGTGKSYLTRRMSEAGFAPEEIEAITVGSDAEEDLVMGRQEFDGTQTIDEPEAVGRWMERKRGLLIVDEANLPKVSFWNGLRGKVTPERRLVFTGNQEALPGRHASEFERDEMATFYFTEFDDAFLRRQIDAELSASMDRREELVDLILGLHAMFRDMMGPGSLSLRDVQELTDRVNARKNFQWNTPEIVSIASTQYSGLFSPAQRKGLELIISRRFGDGERGIAIADVEKKRIDDLIRDRKAEFEEDLPDEEGLAFVRPVAEMVDKLTAYLALRSERIRRGENGESKGKRGMIYEGASARGKDISVEKTLRRAGMRNGLLPEGTRVPPHMRYYKITASLDYNEMERIIKQAKDEGAIVIISEMNLLPSSLLEGKLNDLLTGNATEGFGVIGTINSVDFSGRERLSSALQNRIIYERIEDYSREDLLEIARFEAARIARTTSHAIPPADIEHAVDLHLWLRGKIANPIHHPTTRDLVNCLHAIAALPLNEPLETAFRSIYGPLYLTMVLGNPAVPLPARGAPALAESASKIEPVRFLEAVGAALLPKRKKPFRMIVKPLEQGGGSWNQMDNTMALDVRNVELGKWQGTFWHELSHGIFTRFISAAFAALFREDFADVAQDLEDMRHLNASDRILPFGNANAATEIDVLLIETVRRGFDLTRLYRGWAKLSTHPLTPRALFQLAARVVAKDLLTKEEMQGLARATRVYFPAGLNPFEMIADHHEDIRTLATAFPADFRDEDEVGFQQFRGYQRLLKLRGAFYRLPRQKLTMPVLARQSASQRAAAQDRLTDATLAPEITARVDGSALSQTHIDRSVRWRLWISFLSPLRFYLWMNLRLIPAVKRNAAKIIVVSVVALIFGAGVWAGLHYGWFGEEATPSTTAARPMADDTTSFFSFLRISGVMVGQAAGVVAAAIAAVYLFFRFFPNTAAFIDRALLAVLNFLTRGRFGRWSGSEGEPTGEPIDMIHRGSHRQASVSRGWGREKTTQDEPDEPAHEPREEDAVVTPLKLSGRSESLRDLSSETRVELEKEISIFFDRKLQPGRGWGTVGVFKPHRALKDPVRAFRKSAPQEEKTPTTVVITGARNAPNDPLVQEFVHFLGERGFRVLWTTTAFLPAKQRLANPLYHPIPYHELRAMFEEAFLFAAMRRVTASSIDTDPPAEEDPVIAYGWTPSKLAEAEVDEEIDRLKKFAASRGYTSEQFSWQANRYEYSVKFSNADLTGLAEVGELKRIERLILEKVTVDGPLPSMPRLARSAVENTRITAPLARLFASSRRFENLQLDSSTMGRGISLPFLRIRHLDLYGRSRRLLSWFDRNLLLRFHPGDFPVVELGGYLSSTRYFSPDTSLLFRLIPDAVVMRLCARRPTFLRQVALANLFADRNPGVSVDIDYVNEKIRIAVIGLASENPADLSVLEHLPNLDGLTLFSVTVPDTTVLRRLKNLEALSLEYVQIGTDSPTPLQQFDFLAEMNLRVLQVIGNDFPIHEIALESVLQKLDRLIVDDENVAGQIDGLAHVWAKNPSLEIVVGNQRFTSPSAPTARTNVQSPLSLEDQIAVASLLLLTHEIDPETRIERTDDGFSLDLTGMALPDLRVINACSAITKIAISGTEHVPNLSNLPNLRRIVIDLRWEKFGAAHKLFLQHPNPSQLTVEAITYERTAEDRVISFHQEFTWNDLPVRYRAHPTPAAPEPYDQRWINLYRVPTEHLPMYRVIAFLTSPTSSLEKLEPRFEDEGLRDQYKRIAGGIKPLFLSIRARAAAGVGAFWLAAALAAPLIAAGFLPEAIDARWAAAAVPGLFMLAVAFFAWLAAALGQRAGPDISRESLHPFLREARIEDRVGFISVDPDSKAIVANARVLRFFSRLPMTIQSTLLHGLGIIAHENAHRAGYGEVFAYSVTQLMPALAGGLAAVFLAHTVGIGLAPSVMFGIAGAALFVSLFSVVSTAIWLDGGRHSYVDDTGMGYKTDEIRITPAEFRVRHPAYVARFLRIINRPLYRKILEETNEPAYDDADRKEKNRGNRRISLIHEIPMEQIRASSAYRDFVRALRATKAMRTGKLDIVPEENLHVSFAGNLENLNMSENELAAWLHEGLGAHPQIRMRFKGPWANRFIRGRGFLRGYPEADAGGANRFSTVFERLGQPGRNVFAPALFQLKDDLAEEEAEELQALVEKYKDRTFFEYPVRALQLVVAEDDLQSGKREIAAAALRSPEEIRLAEEVEALAGATAERRERQQKMFTKRNIPVYDGAYGDRYLRDWATRLTEEEKDRIDEFLRETRVSAGETATIEVLDVGAGPGRDLIHMNRSPGVRATGLETSKKFLRHLRRLESTGTLPEESVVELGMEDLSTLSGARFDGVRANTVLMHAIDFRRPGAGADRVVAGIAHVLKPNGVAYALVKEGTGITVDALGRVFQLHTEWSLADLFERNGFRVIRTGRQRASTGSRNHWVYVYAVKEAESGSVKSAAGAQNLTPTSGEAPASGITARLRNSLAAVARRVTFFALLLSQKELTVNRNRVVRAGISSLARRILDNLGPVERLGVGSKFTARDAAWTAARETARQSLELRDLAALRMVRDSPESKFERIKTEIPPATPLRGTTLEARVIRAGGTSLDEELNAIRESLAQDPGKIVLVRADKAIPSEKMEALRADRRVLFVDSLDAETVAHRLAGIGVSLERDVRSLTVRIHNRRAIDRVFAGHIAGWEAGPVPVKTLLIWKTPDGGEIGLAVGAADLLRMLDWEIKTRRLFGTQA